MKYFLHFISIFFLIIFFSCGNNRGSKNIEALSTEDSLPVEMPLTSITFEETQHNFGKVKEGEKVTHIYQFENTGNANLLIQKVQASCGCTTPSYSRKPLSPGEKGSIKVVFNTKGRPGLQNKSVKVTSNTDPQITTLSFTCEVIKEQETEN